jgi:hypothetical protein
MKGMIHVSGFWIFVCMAVLQALLFMFTQWLGVIVVDGALILTE